MRMLSGGIIGVLVLLAVTGCTQQAPTERNAGAPPPAVVETPQGGGTIQAEVRYLGEPVIETIQINKDVEECGRGKRVEKIAVGSEKGLRDAVVSVLGVEAVTPPKAPKEVLDQKNCEFHPRVLATMPGEVEILNSDGILHNIHTFSKLNPPVNKAQPKFRKVITEAFEEAEIIRVRCDVHSWMEAWIVVLPHPFFGVTDDKGRVTIEHVPAGKHQVEVWHPALGQQTKEVEVRAGQTTPVSFDLKA